MTTTIALQDVLIPQREIERDLAACAAVGIKPVRFGLIPFSDEITCDDHEDLQQPAIPFGSVKLIRLWLAGATPESWRVFYSEKNFDQRYWLGQIGELALNAFCEGAILGDVKDRIWSVPVFVKPPTDLKAFAGMVVEAGESIAGRLGQMTQDSSLTDAQPILIAPVRQIVCEYRCFMRGPCMMQASRYRTGLKADHKPVSTEERSILKAFTTRLAGRYQPYSFYAVDVALMPDKSHKVVEYNCINCSGRYEIDRGALFKHMLRT